MNSRKPAKPIKNRPSRRLPLLVVGLVFTLAAYVGSEMWLGLQTPTAIQVNPAPPLKAGFDGGKVLSKTPAGRFELTQIPAISKQTHGNAAPKPKYAVEKTLITYRSYDVDGTPLVIYGRLYQPVGVKRQPIFGFAPGTTGIGDICAASLEQPQKANWANYDSHLITYASQGYATVITDYEGMRDANRLHHYMVGELEGRALLDGIRALIGVNARTGNLDHSSVFLAGYSQGGHSAYWADRIAAEYAPNLSIKGVIGYGAVMDVQQTLTDVIHGANINWFGPYVLASYSDYYKETYPIEQILLPKWRDNLLQDVTSRCIDTNIKFWGKNPAAVYTPEFLEVLRNGTLDQAFPQLAKRLRQNLVSTAPTPSAKLINSGTLDNVVLPQQEAAALVRLCPTANGPIQLKSYPTATHYNTMAQSLNDTLRWMDNLRLGGNIISSCKNT